MDKILNGDFRKELYKNLMEAGYDKNEAQCIVGKKYYTALKGDVLIKLNEISTVIQSDNFDKQITFDEVMPEIAELANLKKILQPKEG